MTTRARAASIILYGGLTLVLVSILFEFLAKVLPSALAVRIGHNSEAYLAVLVLAAWIQFVRPRLTGTKAEWWVTVAVAGVCLAIGILLVATELPSRWRTLNETFLALPLLIPYVQIRRPMWWGFPAALAVLTVATVFFFSNTGGVTDLAETFALIALVPIGLDLVDRGILDPRAVTSVVVRYGWYALLVIVPVTFSVLEYKVGVSGFVGRTIRYGVRITEGFITALLIGLFFAVVLGRTGRNARSRASAAGPKHARSALNRA